MAIPRHRVDIPEELGGGWVEIRERRGFMARTRLAESGLRLRDDATAADLAEAHGEGAIGRVMETDNTGRVLLLIETAVAAIDQAVLSRHGVTTVRDLLRSDELTEELGDWLLARCVEICDAEVRTKSGVGGVEPDAGWGAGGIAGDGPTG